MANRPQKSISDTEMIITDTGDTSLNMFVRNDGMIIFVFVILAANAVDKRFNLQDNTRMSSEKNKKVAKRENKSVMCNQFAALSSLLIPLMYCSALKRPLTNRLAFSPRVNRRS